MDSPLKRLRARLGLTVSEMAEALGLHYSAYYNAEVGLGAIPRKAHVGLEELGVDVDDLLKQQEQWIIEGAASRREAILAKAEVT